jgi:hypothetical protein
LETIQFNCHNSTIKSFENNTALKNVSLYFLKEGETPDFSHNTLLENLYVQGNGIVNIDNCKNLINLYLYASNTKTINLQQSNALKNVTLLSCYNLTSLNLSGCQHLDSLKISEVSEKLDIDISNCGNLRSLILEDVNLNKLNAAECRTLQSFTHQPPISYYPANWNLTVLNMNNCTSLTYLSCNYNKLTELDINGCLNLSYLSCMSNNLKELDAHTCIALKELRCSSNTDLKKLILNTNHQITTLYKDDHTQIVLKE